MNAPTSPLSRLVDLQHLQPGTFQPALSLGAWQPVHKSACLGSPPSPEAAAALVRAFLRKAAQDGASSSDLEVASQQHAQANLLARDIVLTDAQCHQECWLVVVQSGLAGYLMHSATAEHPQPRPVAVLFPSAAKWLPGFEQAAQLLDLKSLEGPAQPVHAPIVAPGHQHHPGQQPQVLQFSYTHAASLPQSAAPPRTLQTSHPTRPELRILPPPPSVPHLLSQDEDSQLSFKSDQDATGKSDPNSRFVRDLTPPATVRYDGGHAPLPDLIPDGSAPLRSGSATPTLAPIPQGAAPQLFPDASASGAMALSGTPGLLFGQPPVPSHTPHVTLPGPPGSLQGGPQTAGSNATASGATTSLPPLIPAPGTSIPQPTQGSATQPPGQATLQPASTEGGNQGMVQAPAGAQLPAALVDQSAAAATAALLKNMFGGSGGLLPSALQANSATLPAIPSDPHVAAVAAAATAAVQSWLASLPTATLQAAVAQVPTPADGAAAAPTGGTAAVQPAASSGAGGAAKVEAPQPPAEAATATGGAAPAASAETPAAGVAPASDAQPCASQAPSRGRSTAAATAAAADPNILSKGRPGLRTMRAQRFTGVYRQAGRWRAQFSHGGLVHQLGMYDSEEAAAQAWDRVAWVYRGRQADLNFPELIHEYDSEMSKAKVHELMDERMSMKKPRGKAAQAAAAAAAALTAFSAGIAPSELTTTQLYKPTGRAGTMRKVPNTYIPPVDEPKPVYEQRAAAAAAAAAAAGHPHGADSYGTTVSDVRTGTNSVGGGASDGQEGLVMPPARVSDAGTSHLMMGGLSNPFGLPSYPGLMPMTGGPDALMAMAHTHAAAAAQLHAASQMGMPYRLPPYGAPSTGMYMQDMPSPSGMHGHTHMHGGRSGRASRGGAGATTDGGAPSGSQQDALTLPGLGDASGRSGSGMLALREQPSADLGSFNNAAFPLPHRTAWRRTPVPDCGGVDAVAAITGPIDNTQASSLHDNTAAENGGVEANSPVTGAQPTSSKPGAAAAHDRNADKAQQRAAKASGDSGQLKQLPDSHSHGGAAPQDRGLKDGLAVPGPSLSTGHNALAAHASASNASLLPPAMTFSSGPTDTMLAFPRGRECVGSRVARKKLAPTRHLSKLSTMVQQDVDEPSSSAEDDGDSGPMSGADRDEGDTPPQHQRHQRDMPRTKGGPSSKPGTASAKPGPASGSSAGGTGGTGSPGSLHRSVPDKTSSGGAAMGAGSGMMPMSGMYAHPHAGMMMMNTGGAGGYLPGGMMHGGMMPGMMGSGAGMGPQARQGPRKSGKGMSAPVSAGMMPGPAMMSGANASGYGGAMSMNPYMMGGPQGAYQTSMMHPAAYGGYPGPAGMYGGYVSTSPLGRGERGTGARNSGVQGRGGVASGRATKGRNVDSGSEEGDEEMNQDDDDEGDSGDESGARGSGRNKRRCV